MLIGIVAWVVIGLIVGQIASKVAKLNGDDPVLGIGLGIVGAVIAGWVATGVSGSPAYGVWSLLAAAVGATLAAVGWHIVRGRATPIEYHNRRYH